ncbi:MAG: hypothetical protein ABW039_11145, partial [Sphingobium sp.]
MVIVPLMHGAFIMKPGDTVEIVGPYKLRFQSALLTDETNAVADDGFIQIFVGPTASPYHATSGSTPDVSSGVVAQFIAHAW